VDQSPELESRVTALECQFKDLNARVSRSEQDAAAARASAGGADRDVAEIRGEIREQNNRLHNATREDLTDLREHVDTRFTQIDDNFIAVRGRLDGAAAGQQLVVELLNTLIARGGDS
jgi:predicted  nucleic acid-binding Zn-ribbon protein